MEFPYRLKNSAEVPMNEDVEQSDAALSLRQKLASESNLPFQDLTSVRNSDTLLVATDAATAAANHESDEEDSDEQGEQLQALDTAAERAKERRRKGRNRRKKEKKRRQRAAIEAQGGNPRPEPLFGIPKLAQVWEVSGARITKGLLDKKQNLEQIDKLTHRTQQYNAKVQGGLTCPARRDVKCELEEEELQVRADVRDGQIGLAEAQRKIFDVHSKKRLMSDMNPFGKQLNGLSHMGQVRSEIERELTVLKGELEARKGKTFWTKTAKDL